jgi:hypothetical protein
MFKPTRFSNIVQGMIYHINMFFCQRINLHMIICAFENSPSIPSFLVTKIVYIGYGQLKKITPFPFTFP